MLAALGAEVGALRAAAVPPAAILSPSVTLRGKSGKGRPRSDWPAGLGRELLQPEGSQHLGKSHSGCGVPIGSAPPSTAPRAWGHQKGVLRPLNCPLWAPGGVWRIAKELGVLSVRFNVLCGVPTVSGVAYRDVGCNVLGSTGFRKVLLCISVSPGGLGPAAMPPPSMTVSDAPQDLLP